MLVIYGGLLSAIEKHQFDVFHTPNSAADLAQAVIAGKSLVKKFEDSLVDSQRLQ